MVQLPLTLAGAGLKDLTLGGDLTPEEVIDCTSVSDIYSKGFMLLILREGNNTLLELEKDMLSCFYTFDALHTVLLHGLELLLKHL